MQPTCAVLLIGDELLSGRTVDQNMNHIARRVADDGIHLKEVRMVADVEREIVDALNALRHKYTYVFTTGGIGPTHDDITVASLAKMFQVPVLRDEGTVMAFEAYYGEELKPATLKMADFPKGAELIPNSLTVAPGFRMENIYCMAGVPKVMHVMLEAIMPSLSKGAVVLSKSIDVYAGESVISADFQALQERFPNADLGSYPFRGENGKGCTSLVIRTTDSDLLQQVHTQLIAMLEGLQVKYY